MICFSLFTFKLLAYYLVIYYTISDVGCQVNFNHGLHRLHGFISHRYPLPDPRLRGDKLREDKLRGHKFHRFLDTDTRLRGHKLRRLARISTDLSGEMSAVDSQMTTGFFAFRPVKGWKTNHSQMTMSLFMFQSRMVDIRFWMLDS